jgi:hypothetical protein
LSRSTRGACWPTSTGPGALGRRGRGRYDERAVTAWRPG